MPAGQGWHFKVLQRLQAFGYELYNRDLMGGVQREGSILEVHGRERFAISYLAGIFVLRISTSCPSILATIRIPMGWLKNLGIAWTY